MAGNEFEAVFGRAVVSRSESLFFILFLHKTKRRLIGMARPTPHTMKSTTDLVDVKSVGLSVVDSDALFDDED